MYDMHSLGAPMGAPNQGPPMPVQFDPMSGRFFMSDASGQAFLLDNGPGNVHIDGPLATVWVDYWFFAGPRFSHCGVDAFQLVKGAGRWRIFSIVDTRRTAGCGSSPER